MDVLIPILLFLAFLGALALLSARLGRAEVGGTRAAEAPRDAERPSGPVRRRPLSGRFGL